MNGTCNIEQNNDMLKKAILMCDNYSCVDGRNAYNSQITRLTLGMPSLPQNENMQLAVQIWQKNELDQEELLAELAIHQVLDLMVFLGNSMAHFREAYRLPLLYDPEQPQLRRIPLQGDAMTIRVCTENPDINEQMQQLSLALGSLGDIIGGRMRIIVDSCEELEYC